MNYLREPKIDSEKVIKEKEFQRLKRKKQKSIFKESPKIVSIFKRHKTQESSDTQIKILTNEKKDIDKKEKIREIRQQILKQSNSQQQHSDYKN